jgi:hypothetical protein
VEAGVKKNKAKRASPEGQANAEAGVGKMKAAKTGMVYNVDHVVREQGITEYNRLVHQRLHEKAVSVNMSYMELKRWTAQHKKEQSVQLQSLDHEGAITLVAAVKSSILEPLAAFLELYPQLSWSKFATNPEVQKVVGLTCVTKKQFQVLQNKARA